MSAYIEYSDFFISFFKALKMQSANASGPISKFLVTVSLYDICESLAPMKGRSLLCCKNPVYSSLIKNLLVTPLL